MPHGLGVALASAPQIGSITAVWLMYGPNESRASDCSHKVKDCIIGPRAEGGATSGSHPKLAAHIAKVDELSRSHKDCIIGPRARVTSESHPKQAPSTGPAVPTTMQPRPTPIGLAEAVGPYASQSTKNAGMKARSSPMYRFEYLHPVI